MAAPPRYFGVWHFGPDRYAAVVRGNRLGVFYPAEAAAHAVHSALDALPDEEHLAIVPWFRRDVYLTPAVDPRLTPEHKEFLVQRHTERVTGGLQDAPCGNPDRPGQQRCERWCRALNMPLCQCWCVPSQRQWVPGYARTWSRPLCNVI